MDIFTPLSAEELDELDRFLESENRPDGCINLVILDGLLTGVVSGPETILPSEWLPLVWGSPEGAQFETEEQAERILGMIFRHMNTIASVLMNSPDDFVPMLYEDGESAGTEAGADEWCTGYVAAMSMRTEAWDTLVDGEAGIMLMPILTFGLDEGYQTITNAKNPVAEYRKWAKMLAPSVRAIHAFWLERRSTNMTAPGFKSPFTRGPKKAGRAGSSSKDRSKKSRKDIN